LIDARDLTRLNISRTIATLAVEIRRVPGRFELLRLENRRLLQYRKHSIVVAQRFGAQ
jgi:hypothetical protein